MVRTKGPVLSLDAVGTIGGELTFQSWKGHTYARKKPSGPNPKTATQIANRAALAMLTKSWTTEPQIYLANWQSLAQTLQLDPYTAYLQFNMDRWAHWLAPSADTPADDAFDGGTLGNLQSDPARRTIAVHVNLFTAVFNWAIVWYRGTTIPVPPDRDHTIHLTHSVAIGGYDFRDTPPGPGTYYYRFQAVGVKGKWGNLTGHTGATIPA